MGASSLNSAGVSCWMEPSTGPRGRLRAAAHRRREPTGGDASELRGDAAARRLLRPGAVADQERRGVELQQGRLSAWELWERQEPFHGSVDAVAAEQSSGTVDP